MEIVRSLVYFALAGLCEIGGGYLMWLWLREGNSLGFGWQIDRTIPDKFDLIEAAIAILGVFIIMYAPRH